MKKVTKIIMGTALCTAVLTLAACGASKSKGAGKGTPKDTVVLGTTDKVLTIDPAGSYDKGSFTIENNIYPFLFNFPYGSIEPKPDVASEKGNFSEDGKTYTVKIRKGLKFANGHELTASDVAFRLNVLLQSEPMVKT